MEARQTFKGEIAPKGLMVVLAVCATVAVAAGAAMISNNLGASKASVNSSTVHAAPGSVLRQDNPVQAGSALIDRGAERGSTVNAAPGSVLRQDNPIQGGRIQNGSRGGVLEDPGFSAGALSTGSAPERSTGHGQLP